MTKVSTWLETFANFRKSHYSAKARFLFIFSTNKMCLYLSLPVFSHWQGRLDPRVMILGRTRGESGKKSGDIRDRDPDLLVGILLLVQGENTPLKSPQVDPLAVETRMVRVSLHRYSVVFGKPFITHLKSSTYF